MSKLDKYKKVISKDDLSSLDLGRYLGEIVLVDTEHALNKACEEIVKCSIIGIDTETKPSFKKGVVNSVALLQIATDKRVYIIRLKSVKMSSELASIFSNKNISTGEGGIITTNNKALYEKIKLLRSHGMTSLSYDRFQGHATKYDIIELGYN